MDEATARSRALAKMWGKVDKTAPNGCWEWTGAKLPTGYGHIGIFYKHHYVHRLAYEVARGPIPEGLQIDHLCRNRSCCNPDHLEAVTIRTNQRRSESFSGVNGRKTHCVRGHEFTPENTIRYASRPDRRVCQQCAHIRSAAAWQRKLAARAS